MGFVLTWLVLAGLWFGLSGYTDAIHLTFGAVSVTLVTFMSYKHLMGGGPVGTGVGRAIRTVIYLPWLFWQITVANIDVMLRIAGFRPVEPRMIRFKAELDSDYGRVLLANSITLTPGTVTVEVGDDNVYVVHAISPEAAQGIIEGAMEAKVRGVEGDA
ncbi:MAG: Na+/H+ antiporter subunit E [Planctomycetota bacterium]|nr:Na+/H+ antiporter subunit E [Planctomycetota bacterium]